MIHIHWHVRVKGDSINGYYECRCGARQIRQLDRGRPMSYEWLLTGRFAEMPTRGPSGHRTCWIETSPWPALGDDR